jgi:putative transposase
VKYAYIASQRAHYPTGFMCRVLEVSTSGFFAWQARENAPQRAADASLREAIVQVHGESRRRYGRRRLTHALRAQGWCVNPKRVRRVMREEGLRGVRKGRFVPRTTDSAHQRAIAPNVLQRRFGVDQAVRAWTSDITYVATREGWLYLAVIIALQTRQVLGYSLSDRMPDELVLNALRNACHLEAPPPGTLFHSDRGSQYASDDFRGALGALGMVASMSRKGNCWDNAVSESFFATLKTEEATEPYATKQEAHRSIAQYIHGFYNPVRLHSSLGYLSPNEYARRMQHVDQLPSMRSAA